MGAGKSNGREYDVDQADKQFFVDQIREFKEEVKRDFHESLASHKATMTELFDTKLSNHAGDIEALKVTTKEHGDDIHQLKTFKEGHQNWHQEHAARGKFQWEIIVALAGIALAAAAMFI
jgi:hypothetical protein